MNQKIRQILATSGCLLIIATVFFTSPISMKPAEAHITKVFGNYQVQVGWNNEPVFTNLPNAAQVTIKKGSGDSATPIINALKNMQISVNYGSVTKQLDFLPSNTIDGQYVASLIPTRVGTYSLTMKGMVENQSIDAEIPLDDVASIDALNFPQASSSGGDGSVNTGQVGTIINQLTNDIEEAKKNSDTSYQTISNAAKSFQDVKDSTDRLYMIGMTGIGIGIAGVVIAVIAITRNKQPNS